MRVSLNSGNALEKFEMARKWYDAASIHDVNGGNDAWTMNGVEGENEHAVLMLAFGRTFLRKRLLRMRLGNNADPSVWVILGPIKLLDCSTRVAWSNVWEPLLALKPGNVWSRSLSVSGQRWWANYRYWIRYALTFDDACSTVIGRVDRVGLAGIYGLRGRNHYYRRESTYMLHRVTQLQMCLQWGGCWISINVCTFQFPGVVLNESTNVILSLYLYNSLQFFTCF